MSAQPIRDVALLARDLLNQAARLREAGLAHDASVLERQARELLQRALDDKPAARAPWPFSPLTDVQRQAVDGFLLAARAGELRGPPSCFGAL